MFNLKKFLVGVGLFVLLFLLLPTLAYADAAQTGVVNCELLNIRESPSTNAKVLVKLSEGTNVTVVEKTETWYKVTYNNVTGYANSQYITIKTVTLDTGVITGDNVNVRSTPSTSSDVIVKLNSGTKVTIVERSGDWYKVKTSTEVIGWVNKEFISLRSSNSSRGEAPVNPELLDGNTSQAESEFETQIVAYAKKFQGVRYVYGGSSPKGFDCSGFALYVYSHFNVKLERVAADQAKHGTKVSRANLKSGDLVFFDTNGGRNYINHVGIYIGNGKFIHASSGRSTHRVTISSLSEDFYNNAFMTARRYIN